MLYLNGKFSDCRFLIAIRQGEIMIISYKKLWKILSDRNMKKKELCAKAGISHASMAKLGKNENVTTDVLLKICAALQCDIGDIVEAIPTIQEAATCIEDVNEYLGIDTINCGLSEQLMRLIEPNSIAVSIWSPPYHVGKKYESSQTYDEWIKMLQDVITLHYSALKPGGFLAINIGDILCFPDESMPRIQANNISMRKCSVSEDDVLNAQKEHPDYNRHQLAKLLGCSEQTIDRRMHGNNIRGGKYATQTRVKLVGGFIEDIAISAGLFPYDRRIWVKDAAWANSNWTSNSYRAVDEFEYVYIFWKPGITKIDRTRLPKEEWTEWGSRAVWNIRSVQRNDDHEAKFPLELPRRIIKLFSDEGETILDCFMGSGTSAIAAIMENRHYIGIDKEEKYVQLAKRNIDLYSQQATQLRLF